MCTGYPRFGGRNSFSDPYGLGVNQSKPYANNYGYGKTGSTSPISDAERQWYIANGFSDPLKQVNDTTYKGHKFLGSSGRQAWVSPIYENTQYYQGVSPEARYLYNNAAAQAKAVSDASAKYAQERANRTNVRAGDAGVRYNYAGAALGIPG